MAEPEIDTEPPTIDRFAAMAGEDDGGEVSTDELQGPIADRTRGEYSTEDLTAILRAGATGG